MEKKKICESLPTFVFNKNCSFGSYDRNKLLMVDPYMMDNWERDYNNLKIESAKIKFEDKKPIAIFRGIGTSPHYNHAKYK